MILLKTSRMEVIKCFLNLKQKIIYSLLYVAMAQHLCLTFKETIHNAKEKLLTFCFYPFGKYLKSYIFKKFMGLQL